MTRTREDMGPVHEYLSARTGMALSALQSRRLTTGLSARMGERTAAQYLNYLLTPVGANELAELVDVVVVHKTELFREPTQLEALKAHVLAPRASRRRPLRVWSAGCATGEEVATLMVLLAEVDAEPASRVLGTDISATALARAQGLLFTEEQVRRVPAALRERYFAAEGKRFTLVEPLRSRVRFEVHNLMDEPYPMAGGLGFDVISCCNVLIYLSAEAAERVVARLAERLAPDGVLMLSATESLLPTPPGLSVQRWGNAFFYSRKAQRVLAPEVGGPGSGRGVSERGAKALRPSSTLGTREAESTHQQAEALFSRVLEEVGGGEPSGMTAESLRRCLALDPDMAAARYLLGMVLEGQGALAEAAEAYRRALRSLREGRARPTPFFLNNARLQVACARAVERVEKGNGEALR